MERYPIKFLVVGCGRFGRRAVHQILDRNPQAIIEVVDLNPSALDAVKRQNVVRVCADGVNYMVASMSIAEGPEWIIPTIPIHLVYHWTICTLEKKYKVERLIIPEAIRFPGEVRPTAWEVYSSLADFLCPEDCPGPTGGRCHQTGQQREYPLHRILEDIHFGDFISRVIRSHQLAPGVGGIQCSDLQGLPEELASLRSLVLLSTASPCHGITAALRVTADLEI